MGQVIELDPPTGKLAKAPENGAKTTTVSKTGASAFGWLLLVPSGIVMVLVTVSSLITLGTVCGDPSQGSHISGRLLMLAMLLGVYALPAIPAYLFLTRYRTATAHAVAGLLLSLTASITSLGALFIAAISHMC